MKRIIITLCFGIFFVINIYASTGGYVEYICPLCNTKFESFTQFSYSTFGQNLDLRPWGAAIIPTPIPKCPECKLVFYEDFLTEAEIHILREELNKNNIFLNEPNMPNYYYLARVAEIVRHDLEDIIWCFLSAVWENRNEEMNNILILLL